MKKSRIIVLFLALAAAAGAFVMATGSKPPPAETVAAVPAPPPPPTTDEVLVAAKDLPLGTLIGDNDLGWQTWPKEVASPGMLRKSENPKVLDEIKGSIVRSSISNGEPIRRDKLIKAVNAGFMSAILPSGKRAVAINIDSQGATTAGGFILPNDRVDVIRTARQDPRPGAPAGTPDVFLSDTLLSNVKVLAIGQNVQEKNGQPVVVGSNATLELDPQQAETVILAQRTGQLSLVLRSMLDARQAAEAVRPAAHGLSVIRYGAVTEDGTR